MLINLYMLRYTYAYNTAVLQRFHASEAFMFSREENQQRILLREII